MLNETYRSQTLRSSHVRQYSPILTQNKNITNQTKNNINKNMTTADKLKCWTKWIRPLIFFTLANSGNHSRPFDFLLIQFWTNFGYIYLSAASHERPFEILLVLSRMLLTPRSASALRQTLEDSSCYWTNRVTNLIPKTTARCVSSLLCEATCAIQTKVFRSLSIRSSSTRRCRHILKGGEPLMNTSIAVQLSQNTKWRGGFQGVVSTPPLRPTPHRAQPAPQGVKVQTTSVVAHFDRRDT